MTDHLLPITAEQLAGLPVGVRVRHAERWYRLEARRPANAQDTMGPLGLGGIIPLEVIRSVDLDLSDLVTRAVVAARIVRPWLLTAIPLGLPAIHLTYAQADLIAEAAERMRPMTPEQIEPLTRLARAALEAT